MIAAPLPDDLKNTILLLTNKQQTDNKLKTNKRKEETFNLFPFK